jgi:hypothetical protein
VNILDTIQDEELFARWFRDKATWQAWFAFIAALFGVPMTPEQLATYEACTGRTEAPTQPLTEAWLICGRRAGKSFILALVAVFLACFKSYTEFLGPGERATVMVIATDRRQARTIFRYIRWHDQRHSSYPTSSSGRPLTPGDLNQPGVHHRVGTASYQEHQGYTWPAVLCDGDRVLAY